MEINMKTLADITEILQEESAALLRQIKDRKERIEDLQKQVSFLKEENVVAQNQRASIEAAGTALITTLNKKVEAQVAFKEAPAKVVAIGSTSEFKAVESLGGGREPFPKSEEGEATVSKKVAGKTRAPQKPTKAPAKKVAKSSQSIPSLRERLAIVMGNDTCHIDSILERLGQRGGWTPKSKDLKSYVGAILSSGDQFINVSRGVYVLKGVAPSILQGGVVKTESQKPKNEIVKTKKPPASQSAQLSKEEKDKEVLSQKISNNRKAVAEGAMPSLRVRLATVIGDEHLKVSDIRKRLADRNWLPESADLSTYLSFSLTSNKETFDKVSRGVYKVKDEAKSRTILVAQPMRPEEIEENLKELGADGDLATNPFQ